MPVLAAVVRRLQPVPSDGRRPGTAPGAVAYARKAGAPALEAYPIDPASQRLDVAFSYVGFIPMFEDVGFQQVIETDAHSAGRPRILMRLDLDE